MKCRRNCPANGGGWQLGGPPGVGFVLYCNAALRRTMLSAGPQRKKPGQNRYVQSHWWPAAVHAASLSRGSCWITVPS